MSNDELISLTPDALISLVVIEAQAREQKRISQLEENKPDFNPSPEFKQKMTLLTKKFHNKKRAVKIRNTIKSVLIAATASISLFSISMLPSSSVREAVKDTLIVWKEKCASIIFTNSEDFSINMPISIDVNYSLEGFELEYLETFESEGRFVANYSGPNEAWYTIRADYIDSGVEISLDNEHSHYYSIEFNNHPALWANMRDGSNTILWNVGNVSYMVYGSVEFTELLTVAENIVTSH